MARIIAEKGDYRLINDGCGTIPYMITIEKKKVFSNGCVAWYRVPNTSVYTDLVKANFAFADILTKEHQV